MHNSETGRRTSTVKWWAAASPGNKNIVAPLELSRPTKRSRWRTKSFFFCLFPHFIIKISLLLYFTIQFKIPPEEASVISPALTGKVAIFFYLFFLCFSFFFLLLFWGLLKKIRVLGNNTPGVLFQEYWNNTPGVWRVSSQGTRTDERSGKHGRSSVKKKQKNLLFCFTKNTLYSRTWQPFPLLGQKKTHQCTGRCISCVCYGGGCSRCPVPLLPPGSCLDTLHGRPSPGFGTPRSLAVSGRHLWPVPLGRPPLQQNTSLSTQSFLRMHTYLLFSCRNRVKPTLFCRWHKRKLWEFYIQWILENILINCLFSQISQN